MIAAFAGYFCPHEGPAQVEAHDGHPGEHGDARVISQVAQGFAQGGVEHFRVHAEHDHQEDVRREDGDDVEEHDFAVQVLQVGQSEVDVQGDGEEEATDAAADDVGDAERLG